jgi:hypothetical protein
MLTLKTGQAEQYSDPVTAEPRIAVPFELLDEAGNAVHAMRESFPADASIDEVREVLQRHLTVYQDDAARHAEASALQAKLDAGAETVSQISNLTL